MTDTTCVTPQNLIDSQNLTVLARYQYSFWVDQPLGTGRSSLSVFIKIKQTADNYLEKFLLANEVAQALETRYLTSSHKTREGYVPYLIFYDLDLVHMRKLTGLAQFRTPQGYTNYAFTLDPNDLTAAATLPNARALSNTAFTNPNYFNRISTQFNPLFFGLISNNDPKCLMDSIYPVPKAHLVTWDDNGSFAVELNLAVYSSIIRPALRFAYVCDPVGNVLAFKALDAQSSTALITSPKDTNEVKALSGVNPISASIFDCPFLRILVEDQNRGYSMSKIPLR